ncbi:hypothetical protein LOC67_01330 [Stieleria sp. JC731]|uniref:hypothetical protein n=1 Tax=Pirellulaceae TaxID=2691357 RepID=UPI001E5A7ECF|nr:hypothetical protein [Stieleria sp. JC731]MCC9599184.1 hypothetical protein [Stieleria sp. JC731]
MVLVRSKEQELVRSKVLVQAHSKEQVLVRSKELVRSKLALERSNLLRDEPSTLRAIRRHMLC